MFQSLPCIVLAEWGASPTENIDIGGSQPDFETCVASLVNHEVPRKVYEVQAIKHRRSIAEDAEESRKRQEEKANQTPNARANRKEEPEEKKRAKNEAVYEVICVTICGG